MSNAIKLVITGMTCDHCVMRVTKALQSVTGVEGVKVTLDPGEATVEGDVDADLLTAAVEQAGYSAVPR